MSELFMVLWCTFWAGWNAFAYFYTKKREYLLFLGIQFFVGLIFVLKLYNILKNV